MPDPIYIDEGMLEALRGLPRPLVCELVRVGWPQTTGDIYYAASQYDELPGYETLRARSLNIQARFSGERFQDVPFSSGVGDESVSLDFSDIDGGVRTLYAQHGPGLKVEVYYYFPELDWLCPVWWGHLQPPEGASVEAFKCKAAAGFRSAQLPLPRRAFYRGCQATFGGKLDSLAVVLDNDCPYSLHLGGPVGNLDPLTGLPYTTCPRHTPSVCIARLEPPGATRAPFFLAFDTVVETIINRQTKGPTLYPTSRGNENNLDKPLRVVFGVRRLRDLDLLAYLPQFNNNNPDKGFVRVLFAACEGRIASMWDCRVNDVAVGFEHLNVRFGERGQPPTGFSPNVPSYSGTALFFGVWGQVNPAEFGPGNLSGSCMVQGLDDIRMYSDEDTYVVGYSTNRGHCLGKVLNDRRWGYGLDYSRIHIPDLVELAAWCDETVATRDPGGALVVSTRSTFNAQLTEQNAQEQVKEICLAGRFGLPFQQTGKMRVVPLRKVEDLDACPVFTDEGADRNIVRSGREQKSSLTYSEKSDAELVNRVVVKFDDASNNWLERSLTFDDVDAQLRAGKAFGDHTQRVVEKKQTLAGVTGYGEAVRCGNLLLDLGPFDEGGLRNNLSVKFTTWFSFAVELHRYKVIRVVSAAIEPYGFEYFRVQSIKRKANLQVEVTAQAYPEEYYEQVEDLETPPGIPGDEGFPNPGGRPGERPEDIPFDLVEYTVDGQIVFRIQRGNLA